MQLVRPAERHLPSYVAALERGWSADNLRPDAAQEELARIRADAAAFLAGMEDREAKGPPVTLPDGSTVNRLPGFRRWLWDGEFCGSIGLRWQPGTTELPPHCLGHIGYAVVPWKQRRGHAKAALAQLLPEARSVGLPFVEITTDPANLASQRVILANGGVLVERFTKPPQFGSKPGLRFRIALAFDGHPDQQDEGSPPMPAGYSQTPLPKKLGLKDGTRLVVLGEPADYAALLGPVPAGLERQDALTATTNLVHAFVTRRQELADHLGMLRARLDPEAAVWVSWPKKSSGMPSEVTEDGIRELALPLGFVDIKVCAVSEVWSGLKLVVRKALRAKGAA